MRTRIGSVKSTQKITKALQMVAAAKLRRAQQAARSRAALCPAHGGGHRQPGGRRLRPLRAAAAGRHRQRTSAIWWSWRPPTAAWPAASIPASCAPRARRSPRLIAEGKDVKIITIGRKARDQLAPPYGDRFVESYEVGLKAPGLALVKPIAQTVLDALYRRRIRCRHPDLQPLQVGGDPDPHASSS